MHLIAETDRLRIRRLRLEDAVFTLKLLNEPSWIEFIGDKQVHSLEDAEAYLNSGPLSMYETEGMGMYLVETRASHKPIGMCGLLRRDTLQDVDMGLAFLPSHWGSGYAREAAQAVMNYGHESLNLHRVIAITLPHNHACIRLLEALGYAFEKEIQLAPDDDVLALYGVALSV